MSLNIICLSLLFYKQLCHAPFVKNGTLSLTNIEDLIGAYKAVACGSSNSTRLSWDTMQAAADPQPAGQPNQLSKDNFKL